MLQRDLRGDILGHQQRAEYREGEREREKKRSHITSEGREGGVGFPVDPLSRIPNTVYSFSTINTG
jgi:hypothetical protein